MSLLYEGADWDFDKLKRVHEAIGEIAVGEFGLDCYPCQVEVISAEQMLDVYSSIGLPVLYRHWSFGKRFARDEALYRKGYQGLAYEIVINSDPCICYVMEENSMTMQALVLAHAAFGHNHFFKNNHLFKQWTDADTILDYLAFARDFVARCEECHGVAAVERILDAAHALQLQGINRYNRRPRRTLAEELAREKERRSYEEGRWDPLWSTLPAAAKAAAAAKTLAKPEDGRAEPQLPEENLLYFIEKNAPNLAGWEREIIRIVRMLAQYFYPQRQTKVMNEGCATFVHYRAMTRRHEKGLIDDGAFLEFLHSHSSVLMQPGFNDRRFGGFNPYALGFAVMQDIERVVTEPTGEDRAWFGDLAGSGDPMGTLRRVWADFRDESFILQFLSPKVIRDFRMFSLRDATGQPELEVTAIHDDRGYREIRAALAQEMDCARRDPEILVAEVDWHGNRRLELEHRVYDGRRLEVAKLEKTLQLVRELWGYPVRMREIDALTGKEMPYGQTKIA